MTSQPRGAKTFQAYIGVQAILFTMASMATVGFTVEVDGEQKYHIDDLSGTGCPGLCQYRHSGGRQNTDPQDRQRYGRGYYL